MPSPTWDDTTPLSSQVPTWESTEPSWDSTEPVSKKDRSLSRLKESASRELEQYGQLAKTVAEFSRLPAPVQAYKIAPAVIEAVKKPKETATAVGEGAVEIGKEIAKSFTSPVESFFERPIGTTLDIGAVAIPSLAVGKRLLSGQKLTAAGRKVAETALREEAQKEALEAAAKAPKPQLALPPGKPPTPAGLLPEGTVTGEGFTMKGLPGKVAEPPKVFEPEVFGETTFKIKRPAKELIEERIMKSELAQKIKDIPDLPTNRALTGTEFVAQEIDKTAGGAARRNIIEPLFRAEESRLTMLNQVTPKINQLVKDIGGVSDDVLFRDYIEGLAKAPAGKEAAWAQAKKTYQELTDWGAKLHDETAKTVGDVALKKRKNYVHHVYDYNLIDDLVMGDWNKVDPRMLRNSLRDQPLTNYTKKRLDLLERDKMLGANEALQLYVNKVVTYATQAKIAKELRVYGDLAQKAKKPNMAEFFDKLGDSLTGESKMKDSAAMRAATGGVWTKKVAEFANTNLGRFINDVLFGRLGPTIAQIGATVPTAAFLGPIGAAKATAGGVAERTAKEMGNFFWKHILKAGVEPHYQLFAHKKSPLFRTIVKQVPSVFDKEMLGPGGRAIRGLFEHMNESLYAGVFNASYSAALKQGLTDAQAVKVAERIMSKTQALYFKSMRPAFLRTELGRFAVPMSNFVFNQFNVLKNDIALSSLTKAEKLQAITNMLAAGVMTNMATNGITGRDLVDIGDFVPFYRSLQIGIGGPIVSVRRGVEQLSKGNIGRAALEALPFVPGALRVDAPLVARTLRNVSNIPASASPAEAVRQAILGTRPKKQ